MTSEPPPPPGPGRLVRPALTVVLVATLVLLFVWDRQRDSGQPVDDATTSTQGTSAPPGATPSPYPQEVAPTTQPLERMPRASSVECIRQLTEVRLDVLTFNIHSGFGGGGLNLDRIADEIEAWDVDIVLMQEVERFRRRSGGIDMPAWFADRLGMEVAYGVNVQVGRQQYGVATFSKYPIVDRSNTHLPNQPGAQQRGLLRTAIKVGDLVLSVYNTHLQHIHKDIRLQQMRTVARIVAADPLPKIVGGDLNSAPPSPMMAVARTVLRDSWTAVGRGPGGTIPPARPRTRIDYLLYSPPLEPRRSETLMSQISDHRAVRTRFGLESRDGKVCVPIFEEELESDS